MTETEFKNEGGIMFHHHGRGYSTSISLGEQCAKDFATLDALIGTSAHGECQTDTWRYLIGFAVTRQRGFQRYVTEQRSQRSSREGAGVLRYAVAAIAIVAALLVMVAVVTMTMNGG